MIDVTYLCQELREWLLKSQPGTVRPGSILHLLERGPTLPENFGPTGIGPWARIFPVFEQRLAAQTGSLPLVDADYLIYLYLPRAVTTDSLLKTLLHEYLHVGEPLGSLIGPPELSEEAIEARAAGLAKEVQALPGYRPFARLFGATWQELKQQGVGGLSRCAAPPGDPTIWVKRCDLSRLS